MGTVSRTIKIDVLEHPKSGLMVAVSDELPGLYVHGTNDGELAARIPEAIRALLEAEGNRVLSVLPTQDEIEGFVPRTRKFDAALAA